MIQIIAREDIPTLRSVVVEGVEHRLGLLKDFRTHADIGRFLPEHARFSVSWGHLEPGEVLAVHVHPTESLIIVARGRGRILGDLEADLVEGDVVLIPGGCHHGFVGAGDHGYWALSVQFEGNGLYEDPSRARSRFVGADEAPASDPGLEKLLARNQEYRSAHADNPFFALARSGELVDRARRNRLLDVIQVWSNTFQKVMMARSAFTDDPRFASVFKLHLDEEYDHNTRLARDRGEELQPLWDPLLEATASWFVSRMSSATDLEKTVLVHLVLETSAADYHALADTSGVFRGQTEHFAQHNELDEVHEKLGLELLSGLDPRTHERLLVVQKQGWDMLNALCTRMAELARQEDR